MNKSLVNAMMFTLGTGVGFLIAKKIFKVKYANLAQEEIDSVKETYERKYKKEESTNNGMTDEEYAEEIIVRNPHIAKSSLDEDSVIINPRNRSKVAYHDMAKENMKAKLGIISQEEIDEADCEEEEDDGPLTDSAGYTEDDFIDNIPSRDLSGIDRSDPYVISDEEYSDEFTHHDKLSFYYYTEDDVLCDENEEPIDDIDGTVGWDCF